MGETFFIPLVAPLWLLFGGLTVIFAFLAVLLFTKPKLSLPRLFFPPWRGYRKLTIAVLCFATVVCAVLLVLHSLVYIKVNEGLVEVSVSSVLTWKSFDRDDVVKSFIVDWRQESGFKPVLRTAGASIDNYNVGWYVLANGKKALLLSLSSVNLVLETHEGYYVLLSPPDFDMFISEFEQLFMSVER